MRYKRPYCKSCKLIWGRKSINKVISCTQCGQPLTFKSFNPWLSVLGGIGVIALGGLTIAVQKIPVIWIGGFLLGGSLIINGFRQFLKILSLDRRDSEPKMKRKEAKENKRHVVFICGQCSTRIRVKKGKGYTTIICPNCKVKRDLRT